MKAQGIKMETHSKKYTRSIQAEGKQRRDALLESTIKQVSHFILNKLLYPQQRRRAVHSRTKQFEPTICVIPKTSIYMPIKVKPT